MEMEELVEEPEVILCRIPKKVRKRKKQLYSKILQQMEFYFSDANLSKDRFLSDLTKKSPYVDLQVFLNFNKIRAFTDNIKDIANALRNSNLLKLSDDSTQVYRTTPIQERENIDECTIYVERIPFDVTHESLSKIFSQFGTVQYVSIPKYKHNKMIKGFAFIEFDSEESAQKTLEHFASIGCKLPSQMPPDKLYSIATFEPPDGTAIKKEEEMETVDSTENKNRVKKEESEYKSEENVLPHECSEPKKIKLEPLDETEPTNEIIKDEADGDEVSEKKRRRRYKKAIRSGLDIKEMGLQVLSKREWKRLRNKYLELQRSKMKLLKQKINRARFSNANSNVDAPEQKPVQEFKIDPGTVIQINFPEPCDLKAFKSDIKCYTTTPDKQMEVKHIDATEGCLEAFVRFENPEGAKKFTECALAAQMSVLEGEAHQLYFEKAAFNRSAKFIRAAAKPRKRGRDRLLRKAEQELGKHIRFEEGD